MGIAAEVEVEDITLSLCERLRRVSHRRKVVVTGETSTENGESSMFSETAVDIPHWYVVKTQPKQENRAQMNLNAWKVETFFPTIKERRPSAFTGEPRITINPLFPGYLFARFQANLLLHKIHYTRGVQSIVNFGNGPIEVDDEIIETIRTQVDKNGFLKIEDDFKVGDEVVIKEGPLRDLVGIFERDLKPALRVVIMLKAISYQGHLMINRSAVARVS
jgi:transcriptional antiterminator RfaH